MIQLPGVKGIKRAKKLIGRTALLEFKLVAQPEQYKEVFGSIDDFLAENIDKYPFLEEMKKKKDTSSELPLEEIESDTTKEDAEKIEHDDTLPIEEVTESSDSASKSDTLAKDEDIFKTKPFSTLFFSYGSDVILPEENFAIFDSILAIQELTKVMPPGFAINIGKIKDTKDMEYKSVFILKRQAEMTGDMVKSAVVRIGQGLDPKTANKPYISLEMTSDGTDVFADVTENNINRRLAIVLDNVVQSAPVINDKIPTGQAQITGGFSMDEANDLVIVLRAGNLPAPIKNVEERTVGPSLGEDSINSGIKAAIIGLYIVILFMIFYYKISGLIADLSLIFNMFIVLAVLTAFKATLTLPGIAGLILTIGMTVDASVLIFERIREELKRGKTILTAIDGGYNRAVLTILDANVTTLITALVLYQFGTGPIRGFAVTLSIGIVGSMFTAIIFTRILFHLIYSGKTLKKISI